MSVIQPLNNTHCRAIIDLIIPIQQEELKAPVTLEGQPDLLDIETNYISQGGNFWGAFIDTQLVGTIGLIQTRGRTGVIRKMFVHKDFRGAPHRIAHELLQTLLTYCRQKNIETIYLGTIDASKAAHRFYEKNGFSKIDVAELPSYFPRMMVDTTFYYLSLKTDAA